MQIHLGLLVLILGQPELILKVKGPIFQPQHSILREKMLISRPLHQNLAPQSMLQMAIMGIPLGIPLSILLSIPQDFQVSQQIRGFPYSRQAIWQDLAHSLLQMVVFPVIFHTIVEIKAKDLPIAQLFVEYQTKVTSCLYYSTSFFHSCV